MTRKTNLTHLIITTVAAAMLILPPAARADIVDTQDLAAQTRAAFSLQHLGHANNKLRFGMAIDPSGL